MNQDTIPSKVLSSEDLEGFVYQINDETFIVNLHNVNDESQSLFYRAELKKCSFTKKEQSQIEVGAKICAKLRKYEHPNGVEKYTCKAHVVPTPTLTQAEIENLYRKADEFLDSLESNDAS